jgi:hypothetical protein
VEVVAGKRTLRHARRHPIDPPGRILGDRHGDPLDTGKALGGSLDLGVGFIGLDLNYQFEFVIGSHRFCGLCILCNDALGFNFRTRSKRITKITKTQRCLTTGLARDRGSILSFAAASSLGIPGHERRGGYVRIGG